MRERSPCRWAVGLLPLLVSLVHAGAPTPVPTSFQFRDESVLKTLWAKEFASAYQVLDGGRFRVILVKRIPGKEMPAYLAKAHRVSVRIGAGVLAGVNTKKSFRDGQITSGRPGDVKPRTFLASKTSAYNLVVQTPPLNDEFLSDEAYAKVKPKSDEAAARPRDEPDLHEMLAHAGEGPAPWVDSVFSGGPLGTSALVVFQPHKRAGPFTQETLWFVLEGKARVRAGGKSFVIEPRTGVRIPKGFMGDLDLSPIGGRCALLQVVVST